MSQTFHRVRELIDFQNFNTMVIDSAFVYLTTTDNGAIRNVTYWRW